MTEPDPSTPDRRPWRWWEYLALAAFFAYAALMLWWIWRTGPGAPT